MKKSLLLIAILMAATSVYAATKDVSKTVHNMGSTGIGSHFKGTIDQVCIYCHTPHNATQSNLLWNNTLPDRSGVNAFALYSSQYLSKNKYGVSLPTGSPSLLCLSCHDGKSAINVLHSSKLGTDVADNVGYGAGVPVAINKPYDGGFFFPLSPANLGGTELDPAKGTDLTNDHPIGFSYSAVATDQGVSQLHTVATLPASIRLFGASQRMECSTCHDPHVNYDGASGGDSTRRPFLVMSNSGSALCLACHNK